MKLQIIHQLRALREEGEAVALISDLKNGRQALLAKGRFDGELSLSEAAEKAASQALAEGRSTLLTLESDYFVKVYETPWRLFIVGAVHIAQYLAPMAGLLGYQVSVVDPRKLWASDERFNGVTLLTEWPDDALAQAKLDRNCAVVVLTHDPKFDDPALLTALSSPSFYIGMLGSKKTQAALRERLRENAISDEAMARIHGPIGLDLGGRSPGEIALSILAEMTARRYGRSDSVTQI